MKGGLQLSLDRLTFKPVFHLRNVHNQPPMRNQ